MSEKDLVLLVLLLTSSIVPSAPAQQQPAPVLSKTIDNGATGGLQSWDFGGTDLTIKEALKELWVVDGYLQPPYINIFNLDRLSAAPRRIPLILPEEVTGAPVLGIAEVPFGDFQGANLILVDPAFATQAQPQPLLSLFDNSGHQIPGVPLSAPQGLQQGAILSSIDVNPTREEIVAYDMASHSFYLLDFTFSAVGPPVPLVGFPSFFVRPWFLGNTLQGSGIGICYNGADRILAPSGFFNAFETHIILEYDLTRGGLYSGLSIDLSAAGAMGFGPDLAFVGIDSGKVGDQDAVLAMNFGDDSVYAFGLLPQGHSGPVDLLDWLVLPSGQYQVQWSLDQGFGVSSIRLFENGVQVASVGPSETQFTSPLPLLGNGFIQVATEKDGIVSGLRPICQLENSNTPPLPNVTGDFVQVSSLGPLADVEVTRKPSTPEEFRGYLIGQNSNTVVVFDSNLQVLETLQPNPPVISVQGSNYAAMGVTLLRRQGEDLLAILDSDGPTGNFVPSAGLYFLQGASRGQRVVQINPIDMSRLSPVPLLLDWDADETNQIVAGAWIGSGYALVRLQYDEASDTIVATQMAPFPQGGLTPFPTEAPVGIGVSILPSGNLLVAGSDTFSRTYTEALLVTPFNEDPALSVKLVGYAQGLPVSGHFYGVGPGIGPDYITGTDTAYFASTNPEEPGVGVTYLPTGGILLISNPSVQSVLGLEGNFLIHADNRCSHPDLEARQLAELTLDIPPDAWMGTAPLSLNFQREVASADYFYTIFNESSSQAISLSVVAYLAGQPVPEASEELEMPPGRYLRRALYSRAEREIQVDVRNRGTSSAQVRIVVGAMGIGKEQVKEVFKRGDCDGSGILEITDLLFFLSFMFLGGEDPPCFDACDADDNGLMEITDPLYILNYMFLGGEDPLPPGPDSCGPDVKVDTFDTCGYDLLHCK